MGQDAYINILLYIVYIIYCKYPKDFFANFSPLCGTSALSTGTVLQAYTTCLLVFYGIYVCVFQCGPMWMTKIKCVYMTKCT